MAFDNSLYDIVLNNKCAEKGDTGKYTVMMKNDLGFDTATVNVIVVGTFETSCIFKLLCLVCDASLYAKTS